MKHSHPSFFIVPRFRGKRHFLLEDVFSSIGKQEGRSRHHYQISLSVRTPPQPAFPCLLAMAGVTAGTFLVFD
jgi:hypothetical protein